MEGLLICTGRRTGQPFFIYETKTNIYSAEELCRYIYTNIETIDERLFDERMVEFLRRCEREDIALRLSGLLQAKAPMEDMVRAILSYVNYYGKDETEQLCAKIRAFAGQPVEERLKAAGDALLKSGKYAMARKQYRRLLEMDVREYMNAEFYGKLWHNLGVTYARMMYFKESVQCFLTAYETYPDKNIRISLLRALKITGDEEKYRQLSKDEKEIRVWEEQWKLEEEAVEQYAAAEGEVAKCTELYDKGHVAAYQEEISGLIFSWKTEYREHMK